MPQLRRLQNNQTEESPFICFKDIKTFIMLQFSIASGVKKNSCKISLGFDVKKIRVGVKKILM